VVPFETLGESGAADRNLDLVLADTLLSALWQAELEGVVLLGRTSMGAELTGRARAEFVARELGASLILEGSLIPASVDGGSEWRVEARLLRLPRGEVAWASTVSGPADEAIPVGELARALAADLARHWSDILEGA
jgi:TolB-like protein